MAGAIFISDMSHKYTSSFIITWLLRYFNKGDSAMPNYKTTGNTTLDFLSSD